MRGVFPVRLDEPVTDAFTEPFWAAALEGRLRGQRCRACARVQIPPRPRCGDCHGNVFDWVDLPGTGAIYTYVVVRHPLRPDLADVVPYVSAIIELDGTQGAGARMMANVIEVDPDTVRIGQRVIVQFDRIGDRLAVPRFRPLA